VAPPVILESTHQKALEFVTLDQLSANHWKFFSMKKGPALSAHLWTMNDPESLKLACYWSVRANDTLISSSQKSFVKFNALLFIRK
jgi:hypothetical protein